MRAAMVTSALALVGALVSAIVAVVAAVPAQAEEPIRLTEQITDRVGALNDRADELDEAINGLYDDHRTRLWVVYVDSFDEYDPEEWADLTAVESDLGIDDVLLAVATEVPAYALSVDPDYPVTDEEFDQVRTVAIEPALQENDWAGAALGTAAGFAAVRSGDDVPAPQITPGDPEAPSGGNATPWVIGAGVVVLLGAAAAYVLIRRRSGGPSTGDDGEV